MSLKPNDDVMFHMFDPREGEMLHVESADYAGETMCYEPIGTVHSIAIKDVRFDHYDKMCGICRQVLNACVDAGALKPKRMMTPFGVVEAA